MLPDGHWVGGGWNSLYCLCNFSVNPKLFQMKMSFKNMGQKQTHTGQHERSVFEGRGCGQGRVGGVHPGTRCPCRRSWVAEEGTTGHAS